MDGGCQGSKIPARVGNFADDSVLGFEVEDDARKFLTEDVGQWLGQVMAGYFNDYAIPGGNILRLNSVRKAVRRLWRQALRRRGQRHRLQWHRLGPYMDRYIPSIRVMHPWPESRFYASHPR